MPESVKIEYVEEPYISANIITPTEFIGNLMKLENDRRGVVIANKYVDERSVYLTCGFPVIPRSP